ncbi:TraR/DksA family transcriptional regulator [Motilibacter aurantiacus]|uniref:TraR/DksA family transcriptional regulator n=1 Tax=Motilibacter aurantiacus TaxID=2714955 RepID=UPI00140B2C50|nr:TraR/DksA C4-type zinc finger protein [Motilibacter aurantiacus]NHC46956.1 molecular chaperone DnaK [Motilibacter aurantiacus]
MTAYALRGRSRRLRRGRSGFPDLRDLHELRGRLESALGERRARLDVSTTARRAEPALVAAIVADGRALAEIEAALTRLDAGTYGRCTGCSGAIPLPRLRERPQTRRCAGCTGPDEAAAWGYRPS